MARAKRNPPGVGHNHRELTDEERGALVTSFTTKLITAGKEVDRLDSELKSARKVVNGIFKLVAKETGYTRKEFEAEVIANLDKSEEELIAAEQRRRRLQADAGLRSGEQLDLIERINDTVDDAIAAEAAGYRAGRRADDRIPPDHVDTIFHQDWLRGWERGQEVNAKAEAMAYEILKRPAPGELAADDEDDIEEEEDPADPETIRRKANALKDSGWTEPSADETNFGAAA
ncbi:hypothetical protein LRS10_13660 [Phenylobacterium sp. J426]|uniref:hypothetical protein n=1 Tax=Phenylobacterium sp. J426 TaxID=2898439 RepID=UPI0021509A37|nr:hypothetical protein [Phenylobacterium sp. J426]MCR5875140.1 hypothetical protein [Phenylobacterium sp. J426]